MKRLKKNKQSQFESNYKMSFIRMKMIAVSNCFFFIFSLILVGMCTCVWVQLVYIRVYTYVYFMIIYAYLYMCEYILTQTYRKGETERDGRQVEEEKYLYLVVVMYGSKMRAFRCLFANHQLSHISIQLPTSVYDRIDAKN